MTPEPALDRPESQRGRASRRRAGGRGLVILTDQAFSSGSNMLIMFLAARALDTRGFGWFALVFSLITFGLGILRSNVSIPLSVDLPRLEPGAVQRDEIVSRSIAVTLTGAAFVSLAALTLAAVVPSSAGVRWALVLLALAIPLTYVSDVGRYVAIASGRPQRALAADAAWAIVVAVVLAVSWFVAPVSAVGAAGTWLGGAALAVLLLTTQLRVPRLAGTYRWFARDDRRRHLSVDAIVSSGTPLLLAWLVAFLTSSTLVAALRGSSTLMSPLNIAITALGMGAVAEVSRRPYEQAKKMMVVLSLGLVLLAAVWGAVLLNLPDSVGRALLGDTWSVVGPVLPFSIIELGAVGLWQGSVTLLRAFDRTRQSMLIRLVYAVLVLAVGLPVALLTEQARWVQAVLAGAVVVAAALSWAVAARPPHRRPVDVN